MLQAYLEYFYLNPRIDISPRRSDTFYCVLVARPSQQKEKKLFIYQGKFGLGVQNEVGQRLTRVLPRECTGHSKHPLQQHKRRLYTWTSPDGQYRNQIDYILCSRRWRSSIQSVKTRPGADYGSDHELLIAKFRLKLEKVWKTTRPFRYDLNQIPYDYTVKVTNTFKGLHLIESLKNYGWRLVTLYRRQGSRPLPRKRNAKKQNGCLRWP